MAYKTVRRDWLKRQVEKGNVEVKCNYSYTDDYAGDAAANFGKTTWMPAEIVEEMRNRTPGHIAFFAENFRGRGGMAYWYDETTIRFMIHRAKSFSFRLKA